jgi:poly-gamma-glutamate synthesis protein (capsule biosynthesis protein)
MDTTDHTVLAVGDVFLNRKFPEEAFTHIQDRLDEADLVIGNHEGPLSQSGQQRLFYPWLSIINSTPEMVDGLDSAGFDVLSLANNQSMNYGPEGILDSIELLESRGIKVTGAGEDKTDAESPAVCTVGETSVAVIGVEATRWDWGDTQALPDQAGLNQLQISSWYPAPHVSRLSLRKFRETITAAREMYDVVLVLPHFGVTGGHELAAHQRAIAHEAVDAGADAVIGAHSHTLQAVEVYESTPIFYSLGNFVFDRSDHWSMSWMPSETTIAELALSDDGVNAATLHPALFDTGPRDKPRLLESSEPEYGDIVDLLVDLSSYEDTELEPGDEGIAVPL